MATTKIFPSHEAAQEYLRERYGLRPYSDRHTKRLIKAGRFPAPVRVSSVRRAWTQEQLDEYAERLLREISDIQRD